MAISFVNKTQGTATPSAGGTFSVTKPASTADGDVGYIACSASDGINGLSGGSFTQLFNVPETGGDSGLWVARKVFSGEGASWTLTSTGGENIAWGCVVFRGMDTTTPEGATTCTSKATSTSHVCGAINVTDAAAWFLAIAECDLSGSPSYTGPGGAFVLDVTQAHATAANMVGIGHEDLAGATGSTSRTLTASTTDVYVACAIELKPAASAATSLLWQPPVTSTIYVR